MNEELTTGGQIEVPLKLWKLSSAKISLIGHGNHLQSIRQELLVKVSLQPTEFPSTFSLSQQKQPETLVSRCMHVVLLILRQRCILRIETNELPSSLAQGIC